MTPLIEEEFDDGGSDLGSVIDETLDAFDDVPRERRISAASRSSSVTRSTAVLDRVDEARAAEPKRLLWRQICASMLSAALMLGLWCTRAVARSFARSRAAAAVTSERGVSPSELGVPDLPEDAQAVLVFKLYGSVTGSFGFACRVCRAACLA